MKNRLLATLIIAALLLSALNVFVPTAISNRYPTTELGTEENLVGIDWTPFLDTLIVDDFQPDTGNTWTVPVSDDYLGGRYPQDFECVLQGVHCNIWVGINDTDFSGYSDEWVENGPGISDDVFYFAYPWSWQGGASWGAPRLLPGYRDYIYGSQLEYIRDQFDTNIHDKVTQFFGMYADRPGPLNDYKIQVLLFNIRDGLFWDPVNAPWFIEGYYSYSVSSLENANIFHMDTYQWWRRQGPNPDGGEPSKYVDTYPPR
jgi:hypothetical protein